MCMCVGFICVLSVSAYVRDSAIVRGRHLFETRHLLEVLQKVVCYSHNSSSDGGDGGSNN